MYHLQRQITFSCLSFFVSRLVLRSIVGEQAAPVDWTAAAIAAEQSGLNAAE